MKKNKFRKHSWHIGDKIAYKGEQYDVLTVNLGGAVRIMLNGESTWVQCDDIEEIININLVTDDDDVKSLRERLYAVNVELCKAKAENARLKKDALEKMFARASSKINSIRCNLEGIGSALEKLMNSISDCCVNIECAREAYDTNEPD